MKDGFVRVAAAIPKISVADTTANTEAILVKVREMQALGAKIMVLPGTLYHRLHLSGSVLAEQTAYTGKGSTFTDRQGDSGCGCPAVCRTSDGKLRQAV